MPSASRRQSRGLLEQIEARPIAPNANEELPVLRRQWQGPPVGSGTTGAFMALPTGRP